MMVARPTSVKKPLRRPSCTIVFKNKVKRALERARYKWEMIIFASEKKQEQKTKQKEERIKMTIIYLTTAAILASLVVLISFEA